MAYASENNMEQIEKRIRVTKLFNIYHSLLSNAQQEILNDYYLLDLSISEIASNREVSRSAIEDALNKGTAKLEEYELAMGLLEKNISIKEKLKTIKSKALNYQEIKDIEEIEKEIDYGIWSTNG